jgi:hypothetical protein
VNSTHYEVEEEVSYSSSCLHVEAAAMPVTYYIVVYFVRDAQGALTPAAALQAANAVAAEQAARVLALEHAGTVAFSRTGDSATGEFQDGAILAQFGEVDLDVLSA